MFKKKENKISDDIRLEKFLSGTGPTDDGYYISDIWKFPSSKLELYHSYIQWIFPLNVPPGHNPEAPYVHHIENVKNETVKENMRKSLDTMLKFYGFYIDNTLARMRIVSLYPKDKEHYQKTGKIQFSKSPWWLMSWNHNLLRLTRIQRSLHLFYMTEEAAAFDEWLEFLTIRFPKETAKAKEYWFAKED